MAETSSNPADSRYTAEHQWLKADGETFLVGITSFAQEQLGDVVYVELPKVGDHLDAGKAFGVIESVKTASDVFAPISGEVVEVNSTLADKPEAVNDQPYSDGWLIRLRPDDATQAERLMTAEQYASETGD